MINVVTATYPFLELLPGRNLVIFNSKVYSALSPECISQINFISWHSSLIPTT